MLNTDIATATPAQIDGEIARLSGIRATAERTIARAEETISRIDNLDADSYQRGFAWNSPAAYAKAVEEFNAAMTAGEAADEAITPLNAEYTRRGGWSRFYFVTNTGGHVHRSMSCATCFPTTQYAWLTDYSGSTDEQIVADAKSQACTVCFEDAPVEAFRGRGSIETPDRKAARIEREAKRAAKAAAEVNVIGYVSYAGRVSTKTFKTVRAVTNDIASNLGSLAWYGMEHPSAQEWLTNVANCRVALNGKGVEFDYDRALAAARKRVVKEGGQPKF
jgi:hypothetical protein